MIQRWRLIALVLSLVLANAHWCLAQQVYSSVPLVNAQDSFYESIGTDWGFSHRGRNGYVFFNRGGANSAIPAFGGYDPNAIARFGIGSRGRNGSFYFNAWAGQGSSRTITSATPSLMLQNGSSGYIQDITVRPFVTGLIPVVGDATFRPVPLSPVEERLERLRQEAAHASPGTPKTDAELLLGAAEQPTNSNTAPPRPAAARRASSAERGDISVAEIRQRQASRTDAAPAEELNQLIETARLAEASGRLGAARIRYQQAAAKASGEMKQALLAKCESLRE